MPLRRLLALLALPFALVVALLGSGTTASAASPAAAALGVGQPRIQVLPWGSALPADLAGSSEGATAYLADYTLQQDGSALVRTEITYRFPAGEQRHGIFLDIPTAARYGERTDVHRRYALSDVRVSSPTGAPDDVRQIEKDAVTRLQIGSPDRYVDDLEERYVVTYRLGAVVNAIAETGTAELYFNALAPEKDVPFHGVRITVRGSEPATRVACYYGAAGATTTCPAQAGEPATFTPTDAQADQGVTVLAEYPRSAFTGSLAPDLAQGGLADDGQVVPALRDELTLLAGGVGLLAPLLMGSLMGLLFWKRGRDERYAGLTPGLLPADGQTVPVVRGGRTPVVVQFTPPEGVQPGLVGTIIDEKADTIDVSATVVDLAARGHLTLRETDKRSRDWELTRTQPPAGAEPLAAYEARLLQGLFQSGDQVHLSQLRNQFASTLSMVRESMYTETVRRGWFRASPASQRGGFISLGILLVMLGVGVPLATGVLAGAWVSASGLVVLGVGLVVAGAITAALGTRMASKTAQGSAVHAQALGFRRYLETAEAPQIRFEEAEQIFSRYLPYAIVFGVAERWASVFAEVAEAAAAQGVSISPPIWYMGYGGTDFDGMTRGLDDFATSAAGVLTSTPGSSGGSGFSSGGGFSGGGGGGGGVSGGSW